MIREDSSTVGLSYSSYLTRRYFFAGASERLADDADAETTRLRVAELAEGVRSCIEGILRPDGGKPPPRGVTAGVVGARKLREGVEVTLTSAADKHAAMSSQDLDLRRKPLAGTNLVGVALAPLLGVLHGVEGRGAERGGVSICTFVLVKQVN